MFSVSAAIPNGSIDVVAADDPSDVRLKLRVDAGDSPFLYYFHFRVAGARGTPCRFSLLNAAEVLKTRLASHANLEGRWSNTGVMASYDRRDWFRVPLTERDGVVSWSHTPERDHVYFAMWPPYSAERRLDLLGELQMSSRVRLEVLGRSVGGRDMDLVTIGEAAPGRRICWVIARQHPSETMGGPLVEGFLRRLTDPDDAVSVALKCCAEWARVLCHTSGRVLRTCGPGTERGFPHLRRAGGRPAPAGWETTTGPGRPRRPCARRPPRRCAP